VPILALVLDDATHAKLAARSPEEPQKAIVATLARFADVDPATEPVVLHGGVLGEIRALLGRFSDQDELLRLVQRGATVNLKGASSGVHLSLTEHQKKRLKEMAAGAHCSELKALQDVLKGALVARFGPY
jgi:hypothetical protein